MMMMALRCSLDPLERKRRPTQGISPRTGILSSYVMEVDFFKAPMTSVLPVAMRTGAVRRRVENTG